RCPSFFTDAAPAAISPLSLHDALPIWLLTGIIVLFIVGYLGLSFWLFVQGLKFVAAFPGLGAVLTERLLYLLFAFLFALLLLSRSEEHTSELQSRFDLVCRLLLEKKKQ